MPKKAILAGKCNYARSLLDKQEPKHPMVKVASVETTVNKLSCTEMANKERPKVTIHVNTQRLEVEPLMDWKNLTPTDWGKYNSNNLCTATQFSDESGFVVVGNAPKFEDLSLWSADGKFIKVFGVDHLFCHK